MGNLEKIMMRDAITQMLADNGINRETLVEMTKEKIGEKVEKSMAKVLHDLNTNYEILVREEIGKTLRLELREVVRASVRDALHNVVISVITKDAHFECEKVKEG